MYFIRVWKIPDPFLLCANKLWDIVGYLNISIVFRQLLSSRSSEENPLLCLVVPAVMLYIPFFGLLTFHLSGRKFGSSRLEHGSVLAWEGKTRRKEQTH